MALTLTELQYRVEPRRGGGGAEHRSEDGGGGIKAA
ncbi:unnamed protein product, partial [Phaeothamnion confervicola]